MCLLQISFPSLCFVLLTVFTLFFSEHFWDFSEIQLCNYFFLTAHNFGVLSKKSLPYLRSSRFSPVLSSRCFIILGFTFRPVIHFELLFVDSVRSVSGFIF